MDLVFRNQCVSPYGSALTDLVYSRISELAEAIDSFADVTNWWDFCTNFLKAEIAGSNIQSAKNDSRITLELFYAKTGSRKHPILKKWQVFKKWQKRSYEKLFLNHIRVVLCKKRIEQHLLVEK